MNAGTAVLHQEREIAFVVEHAPEGGYTARAESASIFTEADTFEELEEAIREALECHFGPDEPPARVHWSGTFATR